MTPTFFGEIMRPSELGPHETDTWRRMLADSPSLHRAFFTPTFALACEQAHGRAYVALLRDRLGIHAFLPFQFKNVWYQRIKLAERIGGNMSDATGLITWPDSQIKIATVMRLARLGSMFVSHLVAGQERFGVDVDFSQVGYLTNLQDGADAYFAGLLERDRLLVRDTERRLRKAEKTYGTLRYTTTDRISSTLITGLIREKREQYRLTQVPDVFVGQENLRLIGTLNEARSDDCRLVMHRLEAGGRILAQHLGLQYHDVLSHWFPVYDREARSVSPGRLLIWHMIQQAAEDGIRLIDFGQGDALYKRELATGSARYGRADWSSSAIWSRTVARAWQSMEWRFTSARRRTIKVSA
jgi:CelD/BcsL family acetyltransferase involved in cellulose biosynthesis